MLSWKAFRCQTRMEDTVGCLVWIYWLFTSLSLCLWESFFLSLIFYCFCLVDFPLSFSFSVLFELFLTFSCPLVTHSKLQAFPIFIKQKTCFSASFVSGLQNLGCFTSLLSFFTRVEQQLLFLGRAATLCLKDTLSISHSTV